MVTRLILIAAFCIMAGCQTVPKGSFCSIAKPIRPSAEIVDKLSDHDVKQLLAHNQKGAKLCGWRQ